MCVVERAKIHFCWLYLREKLSTLWQYCNKYQINEILFLLLGRLELFSVYIVYYHYYVVLCVHSGTSLTAGRFDEGAECRRCCTFSQLISLYLFEIKSSDVCSVLSSASV